MIRKIKTFLRLSPQLKLMTLQALVFSVYTGLAFAFFKRYVRFGKISVPVDSNSPSPDPESKVKDTRADNIARAIQISSQYIPWKNVCRHQAYQAKLLCNFYKIPYQVFIGFKKDEDKKEIQAHAWTVAEGRIITGFCNPGEYTIQSIYSNE